MRTLLLALALTSPVDHWSLPGIESDQWESHPAIHPRTGDVWFVRSDKDFSGWRLLTSHCTNGAWSTPVGPAIAGKGLEADPWFTADGNTLWFISSRASGKMKSDALDIWSARRDAIGAWSEPERLPAPVNSDAAEWFPRPAADGWLYFGSRRDGGFGKDDIWRAKRDQHGAWIVENAGKGINTAGSEYEFQPDAAGKTGVLATDAGLFRIVREGDHWKRAGKLDAAINANDTVIGPMLSPSGKTLVFSRDDKDGRSGELFVAHLGKESGWPPLCSAK